MARIAQLGVVIDPTGAKRGAQETKGALGEIESSAQRATASLKQAAAQLGLAFGTGAIIAKTIQETAAAERAFAIMTATLRTTSGAAGRSAEDLSRLATQLGQLSGAGATAVQGGLTRLLTYTNVQGEAFDRAALAAVNMSAALGMDLTQAAELVGRALQNPEQAIGSLARQGFRFSEQQQNMIKALVATGERAEAAGIILGELEGTYDGVAEAAQNTLGGALKSLRGEFDGLFELPTESSKILTEAIKETAAFLKEYKSEIQAITAAVGGAGLVLAARQATVALLAMGAASVKGTGTASAFIALARSVTTFRDATVLASLAMRGFWAAATGPVGLAIAGFTAVAVAVRSMLKSQEEAKRSADEYATSVQKLTERQLNLALAEAEADRARLARAQRQQGPGTLIVDRRQVAADLESAEQRVTVLVEQLGTVRKAAAAAAQQIEDAKSGVFAELADQAKLAADNLALLRQGGERLVEAVKLAEKAYEATGGAIGSFRTQLEKSDPAARQALALALKAVDANRQYAQAVKSAKDEEEERKRKLEYVMEQMQEADERLRRLGFELTRRAQERREWVAAYITDAEKGLRIQGEELAALRAGGLASREYAIARAGQLAVEDAVRAAQAKGITLTAEQVARIRELGENAEVTRRKLEALSEWLPRTQRGENPFEVGAADAARHAQEMARAMQDVLLAAQGVATAFGESGRAVAALLGSLNAAGQGLDRIKQASAAKDLNGNVVGLGGALSGQAGGMAALSAAAGIGAVFTGVVGIFSSFVTSGRERAAQMRENVERFKESLRDFVEAAGGGILPLEQAIRQLERERDALLKQTEVPEFFRKRVSPGALSALDAYIDEINAAFQANLQRLGTDTLRDIATAFNAATGNDAANQVARAQQEFEERSATLARLLKDELISRDQYNLALAQSEEILRAVTLAIEEAAAAEEARLALEEAARARAREFNARDIGLRERALAGEDIAAERLRFDGDKELEGARKLVEAGELSEEMFLRLAAVIDGEITAALRAAEEAAARAAQAVQDDLAVRLLVAQGKDAEAAALRREIAWRNELAGVTDAALLAQIEYVQQLEREGILKDELAKAAELAAAAEQRRIDQNLSIDERMLRVQGRSEEADALRLQIQREKELREAVDETTRARLEELFAMEDAAAAAKKLADELAEQARVAERLAGLTFDLNIDLLEAEGNTFEAQRQRILQRAEQRRQELIAAGASEEVLATLDRLVGLQLDKLIGAQFAADTAAASSASGRSGVVDAASVRGLGNVSEGSVLRLIDVAATQLTVLRSIDRNTAGAGGGGVSIQVTVQTGAMLAQTPAQVGREIATAITPVVNEMLGRRLGVDRGLTGTARLPG